jgi:hypothetical protein
LSKKVSLSIENKMTFTKTDLLEGQQWQENSVAATAQTRDYDVLNFLSAGLNISLGAKSVQPLWWSNPLDYAYNEINKPNHMKLPKPVLDDADGDGVPDQFDNEPNTPAGSPVDAHGVSRDTDGDGVPDAKDKELITPTQCQPVDADGVGYNINADLVAGAIGGALRADSVIFLTDVDGLYRNWPDEASLIDEITIDELKQIAPSFSEGMIPKVAAAINAIDSGAFSVRITNGTDLSAVLDALDDQGGTLVSA